MQDVHKSNSLCVIVWEIVGIKEKYKGSLLINKINRKLICILGSIAYDKWSEYSLR